MKKEFLKVKGFYRAICFLEPEDQANLLLYLTDEEVFEEDVKRWANEGARTDAALALAAIYYANNEDE